MRNYLLISLCFVVFSGALWAQDSYDRSRLIQYYQNQDYDGAIDYLLPLSGNPADPVQFNNDLGYSYFMNDQPREALRLFRLVYQLQPANVLANLYMAQVFADMKQTDSTLFFYKNLIFHQPANFRFWQKAAQVFYGLGNYDSARYYFQKAYDLNQRSGTLVVQFTDVLIRLKDLTKADKLLQDFLALDSSNRDVIAKRIDVSYRKADFKTAIYWGEKLWHDSADLVLPYINLAYSYLGVDSLDKCIALAEWLIYKNKETQSLIYCAAQAYSRKKNYLKSNELLDECLRQSIQQDAVQYFNAKSDNYEAMKQYKKAISYYDTSYYIFKSAPDLYYTGRIYDKYLNNKAKARDYYRQFLDKRKNPRNSGEKKVFDYIKEYLERKE